MRFSLSYISCFLFAVILLAACENDVHEVQELGKKKPSIEEGKDIDSYLSMGGKLKGRLRAPVMIRYQGDSARKTIFPNTLHVDFYNDSTKIESQISARYGQYLENENKVLLRDHVVAFNTKGDTLFSDELYWDKAKERFYTDKKVIVSRNYRAALFVGRNGMNSNQQLTDIQMFGIERQSYTVVPDSMMDKPAASPAAVPVKP